nr:hypothetical protein [Fodinicola feengrottensis]
MSERRMMASARAGAARDPRPSAVSAKPSRCRQRVAIASTEIANVAAK